MPYRDERPVPTNPREEAAIADLSRRTSAVRAAIVIAHVALGIALGSVLYGILRDWQMEHRGGHMPYVTGMVAMVPTFGSMLRLAPYTVRYALRALLPSWRASLARKYALDRSAFEELTALLER